MTDQTTDWRPIDTAPREPFEIDVALDNPLLPAGRLRMGPEVMLRGKDDGETIQARACWSVWGDKPGHWFDTEAEEPLDWPMTEWRPLTAEEAAADAE